MFTGSIYASLTIYIKQLSSFALFKMLYDILTTFLIKCYKHDSRKYFNLPQSSVAFHIETGHLIYTANQMTGFYMKCNSGLEWVNSTCRVFINGWVSAFQCNFENMQNMLISLMNESLYFVHTRNYKQETIYYIQE